MLCTTAECCPLYLGAAGMCSPTPKFTLAHLALQDSSTQPPAALIPTGLPFFFLSWIPDAACKLHSIFCMMFKRWVKNPLNLNYRRTHGSKSLLTAKGPIYPTQRHFSSKGSPYKKPNHSKHSPQ